MDNVRRTYILILKLVGAEKVNKELTFWKKTNPCFVTYLGDIFSNSHCQMSVRNQGRVVQRTTKCKFSFIPASSLRVQFAQPHFVLLFIQPKSSFFEP